MSIYKMFLLVGLTFVPATQAIGLGLCTWFVGILGEHEPYGCGSRWEPLSHTNQQAVVASF